MCKVLQTSFATLLFERVHAVRETVDEPQGPELALGECCALVEARGGDVTLVAERDALWNVRGEADEGSCKLARQTELTS